MAGNDDEVRANDEGTDGGTGRLSRARKSGEELKGVWTARASEVTVQNGVRTMRT